MALPFDEYAPSGKYSGMQTAEAPSKGLSCGVDALLTLISGKWKLRILHFLVQGTWRYGELRRSVGAVTDKVLIQQLKELEADGVIVRTDHGENPPRVDYALTPFGRTVAELLAPLCAWGRAYPERVVALAARKRRERVAVE